MGGRLGGNLAGVNAWERLVAAARRDDPEEFDRAFAELMPWITALAEREMPAALRKVLEPSDAAQQVAIVVFRKVGTARFERESAFRAWLERVARSQIVDLCRRHFAEVRGAPAQSLDESWDSGGRRGDAVAAATDGPATRAASRDLAGRLAAVLSELPEASAAVLRARVLEGKPASEVARALGKSEGAIHQIQHRALLECRELFRKRGWLTSG